MKAIIVEGIDNIGKDTQINKIIDYLDKKYNNDCYINLVHCCSPKEKESKMLACLEQVNSFNKMIDGLVRDYNTDNYDYTIFNRAWYGEYVYGPIYRDAKKQNVLDMIERLEYKLNILGMENVYYIQLTTDSVKLALNNDDEKSLSKNDEEKIKNEINSFNEVFDKSILTNKIKVKVNKGDKFRDPDDIFEEIKKFIEK